MVAVAAMVQDLYVYKTDARHVFCPVNSHGDTAKNNSFHGLAEGVQYRTRRFGTRPL